MGSEVLSTANKLLIASLVPAMETLQMVLVSFNLNHHIKMSTPHSLGILLATSLPSTGKFRQGYNTHVLKPLLGFLRSTYSLFMVNPYPFLGYSLDTIDYALFRPNLGVLDKNTELKNTIKLTNLIKSGNKMRKNKIE